MPTTKHTTRGKSADKSVANYSEAIDEQLKRYRAMRNFDVTEEPKGSSGRSVKTRSNARVGQLPFVVQKHAATHLHYDFRLGWRGVLKSWAVAKGPSYFPGDKRLAVQVEDHPIEYGGFEGIIPKGQYGGGTVMLWDEGTWEPHGDTDEGLKNGRLKFTLYGKKLHGDWALIRMGGKAAEEKKPNWLLIKEHDRYERGEVDPAVVEAEPDSAVTGRDLDAIARNQDHVWGSQGRQKQREKSKPLSSLSVKKNSASSAAHNRRAHKPLKISGAFSELRNAPKETLPRFVPLQLALQVKEAPEGVDWIHELKLDGYRIQARIDHSKGSTSSPVTLITRSGLDWSHRMPDIAHALAELPVKKSLLDGEVVVFDKDGRSNFAQLQAAFQEGKKQQLTYVVFDLLHLDGHNLRGFPLEQRKKMLKELLSDLEEQDTVRFSEHLGMLGKEIFQKACELGAEGIVSKRISAPYVSGRNGAWLKIKCIRRQEFVIGGFTPPSKSGVGIGALLLGYYKQGKLVYAGRTGTGFTQKTRKNMRTVLEKMRQDHSPFKSLPAGAGRESKWVKPKFVCEVNFATWTADNLIRQASFQGLREDKPAKEVKREIPVDLQDAKDDLTSESESKMKSARATKKKNAKQGAASLRSKAKNSSSKVTSRNEPFPITLTHPDKQVDSETKLTKHELADYFWAIRDHMLPYISNRPLSIVRCPQGSTKPCFFQKHVTGNFPEEINGINIRGRKSGAIETYITLSTPLGLAGLAQMGVLEIHTWGSRNSDIEKPDMLIFDLDPDDSISWATLAESAREVRSRLRKCKLESFLKTTGGKGLHVVAPIEPKHDWPVIKNFALAFASRMELGNRRLYLTKMTKAARKGKIYIDYLRNERGATSIAPYSPRARHGAPVALPLDWKELDEARVPRFLVAGFDEWKERLRRNPWKAMLNNRQSIRADVLKEFSVEV